MGPAGYEISYGRTDRHVHILTHTIPPENTLYLNEGPRPWGGSAVVVNKVASSFTVSLLLPACRQPRRGRNQLLNDITSIRGSILKTLSSWSNPFPIFSHWNYFLTSTQERKKTPREFWMLTTVHLHCKEWRKERFQKVVKYSPQD